MIAKVNPMINKYEIVRYKIMWEVYYAYENVMKSFNEVTLCLLIKKDFYMPTEIQFRKF